MKLKRRPQTQEVKAKKNPNSPRQEIKLNRSAGGGIKEKLFAQRDVHAHALFSSLGRLLSTPFASTMTIAVLAIALSLAGCFQLMLVNIQQIAGNLEVSAQISIFLRDNVTESKAQLIAESLRKNPAIETVQIINKEQGRTLFKSFGTFGSAIDLLGENPLPIVLEIKPKNTLDDNGQIESLVNIFKQQSEVDYVRMDIEWLQRLQSVMAVARRLFAILNVLLGFAVLFITGNTIRLELNNRKEEIIIAKLVGATNGFIARPFVYSGFWIGFLAGVLAWFVVALFMLFMRGPVETLSAHYNGDFHLLFLSFTDSLKLILLAALLGMTGSWLVLVMQLKKTNPK